MDEETKTIFVPTNPIHASFSIVLGPIEKGSCTAYVKFYGFGTRKEYLLFCLNTGDQFSPVAMHSLTLEDRYVIEKPNGVDVKKNFFALHLPAIPGFQSTWYLWSEDNTVRLCQETTAKPLEVVSKDKAALTIIRKESGGNFVDIQASGLRGREQVCFVFRSLGQEFRYPCKATESGKVRFPILSSFAGMKEGVMSGTSTVLLVRKEETLELSYDWDLSTTQVAAKR
jgi:hypothetical protein